MNGAFLLNAKQQIFIELFYKFLMCTIKRKNSIFADNTVD